METKNKAIVVNLLSNGPQIEEMPPKQEELNNCIDIQTQETKASLLNKLKDEDDETFIKMNDGNGSKQEPIWFRVKKECLLKVTDNVFFKMNKLSTMIQQCPVDYKLEINNKDNSITIKTITANTGGYHTSYHDSTITYECFLEPTKYFQILPSGDIKFSTQKEFYQTKNPDHSLSTNKDNHI